MNKELLKFFAGFFFASILLHILIVSLGFLPFTIKGMVFDYSFWTITLVGSSVLAVLCSYLGWDRKLANKISISVLFFVLFIVFICGSYFGDAKNFSFISNKSFLASVSDINKQNKNVIENIKNTNLEDLTYAFSLGDQNNDFGKSIISDKNNNTYSAGAFHGTINLNSKGKAEKTSLGGIGNDTDIYIVKHNQYGEYVWGFSIGSIGYDSPSEVRLDSEGYVYLSGYFGGKADFDPSEKEFILDAGIGRDGFIAKYDSDGRFLWANKIGNQESIPFEDNDIRFEQVSSIGFGFDNNVYVIGYFDEEIDFKDIQGNTTALTALKYSKNIFLAKYDKNGNNLKSLSLSGGTIGEARKILVGSSGEIYLAGIFNSKIALNPNDPKKFTYTTGGQDIFLSKYDSEFNYLWSKKWGSLGKDDVNSMSFSQDGNIIFVGSFNNLINFQGIKLQSSGGQDIFFSKINPDGNIVFSKKIGGAGRDGGLSITIDSLDNIYITGYFSGKADFDPNGRGENSVLYSFSSGDATDAFISKYNQKGIFMWVKSLGGDVSVEEESQNFSGISVDNLDYPVVIGSFGGDFDLTDNLKLSSKGGVDSVVVKYDPEGGIGK
ncbi:MAG: hypothetical protein PHR47_03180 [Candidatus Pacebacteria bacterium]|nr:hypothetical protein [Candidatus Paceibacterota bacterium]